MCVLLLPCGPRVGDRLVMEQLMVEVLEELTARELLPQEAAAVMQLAGGCKRHVAAEHTDRGQQAMHDRGESAHSGSTLALLIRAVGRPRLVAQDKHTS